MNFFITGLPRSRTAWIANFFSTGDVFCWHEAMAGITSKAQYWERLSTERYTHVGNSDCTLYMGGLLPNCPLVIIERDVGEVDKALTKIGFAGCLKMLEESQAALDKMDGLRIPFYEINDRLEEIHQHCVDTPVDSMRAHRLTQQRVELLNIIPDVESIRLWAQAPGGR